MSAPSLERDPKDPRQVVEEAIAAHRTRPGALLPIFHAIQDVLGYVPSESLGTIAQALNVSRADVYGTLTFYHDFRSDPPGRHVVKLCRAEACQAVGSDRLVDDAKRRLGVDFGETRADRALTLEAVYCLGNCALGPSALVDGRLMARVTVDRLASRLPDVAVRA
jgi:formate dehydrogenase subunit gamma